MHFRREVLLVFFLYHNLTKHNLIGGQLIENTYKLPENEQIVENVEISAKHIALLVEDSSANFKNVLNFFQSVLNEESLKDQDLWLITFNSSGASSVWEKSFQNLDKFHKTLQTLASASNLESDLGSNNSLALFALLHTAQILPRNSAIIIFTDLFTNRDIHLENLALNSILSKNITVYTINDSNEWTKDLLQHIREYSGGKIIKIDTEPRHEDYTYSTYAVPNNVSVILSKKNLLNTNALSFPVDYDVTGIHITVAPSTTTNGTLVSPGGYKFSFTNKAKSNAVRYSQGSVFENENGFFDIHLNFSTSGRPTTGMWQLKLENVKEVYNVTVFAFTNIAAKAQIHFSNEGTNQHGIPKDVMKLGVTGNISHITDISVLDRNGETLLSNISYKFNNDRSKYVTENIDNAPDIENKELDAEINKLQHRQQPFYALIRGKDIKGQVFQRLSYILGKSDIYPQQTLTVDVGLGSELIVDPGRRAEIYFEVTNYASRAQYVSFTCSDSKYILQSLSRYRRYLEPQESTTVILYVNTRYGTYQDEITFSATNGLNVVRKKVLLDVGSPIVDQTQPELDYKYTSDCTGVIFNECKKGTWTVEITARDTDSGLLQVNTIPKGLFFPYGYTSGTRDSVSGFYSESCCNPDLQISAVDRMNNRRSYDVNAYHARLSVGAISAIVLGILLFIILVAVIIFLAVKKWKTKESYDLPTYRGGDI